MKYKISSFHQWLLKLVTERITIQSHEHQNNIVKYYEMMYIAAKCEFTEDNDITLKSLLLELFMKSINADKEYILKMLDVPVGTNQKDWIFKK